MPRGPSRGRPKSDVNFDAITRALADELRSHLVPPDNLPRPARGVQAHFFLAHWALSQHHCRPEHPQHPCQPCALATVMLEACYERSQRSGIGFDGEIDETRPQEHHVLALARDLWRMLRPLKAVARRLDGFVAGRRQFEAEQRAAARTGLLEGHITVTDRLALVSLVLSFALPVLEWGEGQMRSGFDSADLQQPFGRKPTQKVLAQWEALLIRAGFTLEKVARLVPDGGGAGRAATTRIRKRAQRLGQ